MEIIIKESYEDMSRAAAQVVAKTLNAKPNAVLGLATGSTPLALYKELIRMHKEDGLDFQRVTTFNLDEYVGLPEKHDQSYHYFMYENLFKHINIPMQNTHVPRARRTTTKRFAAGMKIGSSNAAASICKFWGSAPTGTSHSTSRAVRWGRGRASRPWPK